MDGDPVGIPGLDVRRAKRYSRIKLAVFLVSLAWSVAQLLWLASGGRSTRLKQAVAAVSPDRRLAVPGYFAAVTAAAWLASLPLRFAGGWFVERRFGLTGQSPRAWFADQLKGLALSLVIQPVLLAAAWTVIRRRPRDWWLVLAAVTGPLAALFGYLAPLVIMPLFNRYTPLEDEHLAARLRDLAGRAGVAAATPVSVDLSRQTDKPNAFFAGIGSSKRIALSDTLLRDFERDEIEGVIAHELGHQAHGDIWRLTGFTAASGFALSWALSRIAPPLVRRTAPRSGASTIADEASYPIVALVLSALGFLLAPIQAAYSRAIERRTDRFAVELTGDGPAFARALARLASASLADPDPPRPLVLLLYSHPPVAERIRAARARGSDR